MPFRVPGEDLGHSDIAVSFVVSFQNRWASFDDPNRWLFRFEEDMREIHNLYRLGSRPGPQGGIDEEMHERLFPRYWHSSDYMQHRIIGPVVVQVYENYYNEMNRNSDPLQPGIYHAYPKASEWEAPGPILRDEQLRVTVQSSRENMSTIQEKQWRSSGRSRQPSRPTPAGPCRATS